MATRQIAPEEFARASFRTAAEAFSRMAEYLGTLQGSDWEGPTACEDWNMRTLADHATGEAVWLPNLTRNAVRGEALYPMSLYDEMKTWHPERVVGRLREAADEFRMALDGATEESLSAEADLGFARMPLWQASYVSAFEGAFHGWDAEAIRDPQRTIPTPWAVFVAGGILPIASGLAHRSRMAGVSGTYLLQVGDGVGPVTVRIGDGNVTVEPGETGSADVTLSLTADQYIRFLAGRLKLDSGLERDRVGIEGDRARAAELNHIFGGVANGD